MSACGFQAAAVSFASRTAARRTNQPRRHFVQRANELTDRRLHRGHQLRQQLIAARQQGQRLDALFVHDEIGHPAGFDDQLVVVFGKTRKAPWPPPPDQLKTRTPAARPICRTAPVNGGSANRATRQGVLQHTQLHTLTARLLAQPGDRIHIQPTVFGDHDRSGHAATSAPTSSTTAAFSCRLRLTVLAPLKVLSQVASHRFKHRRPKRSTHERLTTCGRSQRINLSSGPPSALESGRRSRPPERTWTAIDA